MCFHPLPLFSPSPSRHLQWTMCQTCVNVGCVFRLLLSRLCDCSKICCCSYRRQNVGNLGLDNYLNVYNSFLVFYTLSILSYNLLVHLYTDIKYINIMIFVYTFSSILFVCFNFSFNLYQFVDL